MSDPHNPYIPVRIVTPFGRITVTWESHRNLLTASSDVSDDDWMRLSESDHRIISPEQIEALRRIVMSVRFLQGWLYDEHHDDVDRLAALIGDGG